MFFRNQSRIGPWLNHILALLILTVYCVSITSAQQLKAGVSANLKKFDKPATVRAYNDLSAAAMRAFMAHLTDPTDTKILDRLVVSSKNYITMYPTSERVNVVNYYIGKTSVLLDDVETGIATLEKVIRDTPPNYVALARLNDNFGSSITWNLTEHALLELGLAYDKQKAHDKANAVYKKLIAYPDFVNGVQARVARQILELDTALRTGEVPTSHGAWIGQSAPNFRMRHGEGRRQSLSLNRYEGQVVLLYYGGADTQNLNLAQLHDMYKDKKFQIITVNADISEPHKTKPVQVKGDAWIHYHDRHGKLVNMYQIRSLPAVFLIDANGVVRKTYLDAVPLEKAVEELVKENLATYDDPRTQEIVDAAVKAHGGLEKLRTVENIVMNMRLFEHFPDDSWQDEGSAKVYYYRDKFRAEFHTNEGEQFIQCYDGTSLYMSEGVNFEQLPPDDAKYRIDLYKDTAFREPIWILPNLSDNKIPVQYVGTENVKGVLASILRVRQPTGKSLKIFISEKTHLIVQFEVAGGRVNTFIELEQYKDVDGIKIAHYSISKDSKDESHHETSFTNITLNAEIDPELFNPKK